MQNALEVSNTSQGGLGLGVGKLTGLLEYKPETISIVQPTTQADGAIKGKLRLSPSGEQFDFMNVALLAMPTLQRQFYLGEPGQLNRSPENLMCFTRNVVEIDGRETQGPDVKSRVPQSLSCSTCPNGDWTPYRTAKEKGLKPGKELFPPCETFYHAYFIDLNLHITHQMYIRSTSKAPLKQGMSKVSRMIHRMRMQGLNPNLFDVGFRISAKPLKVAATTVYMLDIGEPFITLEEHRPLYEELFYEHERSQKQFRSTEVEQINHTSQEIDAEVGLTQDDDIHI